MRDHRSCQSLSIVVHLLGSSRIDLGPVPLLLGIGIDVLLQVLSYLISGLVSSYSCSHNLVNVMGLLLGVPPDGLAQRPALPIQFSSGEEGDDVLRNIAVGSFNLKTSFLQPVRVVIDHSLSSVQHSLLNLLLQAFTIGLVGLL